MNKGKSRKGPLSFPEDCVFEVLRHLSAKDLAQASTISKSWKRLSEMNVLWQWLCLDRWRTWPPQEPTSTSSPERIEDLHSPLTWYSASEPPFSKSSWKQVYQHRHEKDAIVQTLLDEIIQDSRNRIAHIEGIADMGMIFARDVLEDIMAGRNGQEKDLSRTYYARKIIARLQRGWVMDQWRAFRNYKLQFPIWQGCGLLAMFSNPDLTLEHIDRQLQALVNDFLIFSPQRDQDSGSNEIALTVAPAEQPWTSRSLEAMLAETVGRPTTVKESKEASIGEQMADRYRRHYEQQTDRLRDLIHFFTVTQGFKGSQDNLDYSSSLLDRVLTRKEGTATLLCIIFAELASRVGIQGVELMTTLEHFLIRYQPVLLPVIPGHDVSQSPLTMQGSFSSSSASADRPPSPPPPPKYYLDLFHPPYRLLTDDEIDHHLASVDIPSVENFYRNRVTPAVEIYSKAFRGIMEAATHAGEAGR
ncbi:hypothetical protein BGZ94_000241, partial [Podila epigama]